MKHALALVALLALGCSHKTEDVVATQPSDMEQLTDKRGDYLEWTKAHQDANGFIETDDCDSLNFTGLLGAGGAHVNILAARDAAGAWHRRPTNYTPCYPTGSASEISQDAFLSLGWYLMLSKDVTADQRRDIANALLQYGLANKWVMGEGRDDLTTMPFWTQSVIAEMAYRWGGDNDQKLRDYLNTPVSDFIWQTGFTGFRAHLQVLLILFRGDLVGSIDSAQLKVLNWQVNRQPNNALFQYAVHRFTDGDQTVSRKLALDNQKFPSEHLPTDKDRDCHWLFEVDESSCQPGTGTDVFSGGDYLFITALLAQ